MIEEPVSDVEIKSEGTSDGPDEDAELVIVTNELEEHCYSKVKLKLFEQRRTRHAQDPEPDVPIELLHGWRIVSFLMSTNCRSFCGPFLDKPETSMREYWRNYADALKNTTWLGKIKQEIVDKKTYETIGDIVGDVRRMLECCYHAFGPHHPISKKGIKLEHVLETKVQMLPRDLRERSSIDATRPSDIPRGRLKVEDGESMLIAIIRHERAVRGREQRFRAREGKKFEKEALAAAADMWDAKDVRPGLDEVQAMWEVPHIAHFLFLAQHALGFPEFTMFELERSLLYPQSSQLLHSLMTCLLTTGFKSVSSTASKPPMGYREWNEKLRNKLVTFYKTLNNHGILKVFEDTGVEEEFFQIVGEANPFDKLNDKEEWCTFEDFTLRERVAIIKALCDQRLAKHKSVADYFVEGTYLGEDMRQLVLGTDLSGREYFYFPCLSNHDVRVYSVQQFPRKASHDDCYQVAIKRVPRSPKPPTAKKRKKKTLIREEHIETKSRRRSAKQAAKAIVQEMESSDESCEEEFDEEVVVYNSDGCMLMSAGEQQHQLEFKIVAENLNQLRALIERLKGEAETKDKENNGEGAHEINDEHSREANHEYDETSNDTQLPNDESSNGYIDKVDSILEEEDEVEEEDLSQTQKLERSGHGQESDSRSALSVQEEESSQDTNHTQPRRSSRAHKQTQRFAEMDDHDDETMAAPAAYERATAHQNHAMVQISTRRSSRRIENGTTDKDFSKVDSLSLKRKADSVPRERITMKIMIPKDKKASKKQPSNKRLIAQLESILEQFLPFEAGFAQNEARTRLKLYTEVHHPQMLVEEQKRKAEEDKTRRSKRIKDPWSTSSQYMDNEILYGDAAFDGISDSDDDDGKSKRPQPTRRSNRGHHVASTGSDETGGVDKEWRCRDGERF
ncbi:uncharacterized protein LOC111266052 isoform X2 [Varroa jacobsoni]|uniref:Uncharacterized protein n=1 Tax=Varroa destructor TaxID=109461 RepID=A0A7M7JLB0_VARDE|nr:uncharacterized protein LOC111245266 [Varroa destructor]XP_022698920.1 uncharacterized protein LOC111266052 isoform X2 [Varroa jacobsoni]